MATGPDTVLRYIRRLVSESESDSDAALLDRFISARDERAFTALLDRHGPPVFHVCQRVLGDVHAAEDAFQAVFLILARKATAVHPRHALAAWLHGVARRVALKARAAQARQAHRVRPPTDPTLDPRPDPLSELSGRELIRIVDEEVERLPEVYRLPVIVCCLQGRSLEEAARQLGWTRGSVKGRLERGRARLHERLLRRGLTLSAALAAAEVSRGAASAAAVAALIGGTVRVAVAFGAHQTGGTAGVSAGATALARETIRGMTLAKLKIGAALLTCLLTTGLVMHSAIPSPSTAAPQARSSPFPPKNKLARVSPITLIDRRPPVPRDESDTPIEVSGLVLDPNGKPFAGARMYVGLSVHRFTPDVDEDVHSRQTFYQPRATSGIDGWFHFTFATSELDAKGLDDWRPAVIAVTDRYGPDWIEVGEPGQGAALTLKLVDDFPVDRRILDANQQPAVGTKVLVHNVISDPQEGIDRPFRGQANSWYPHVWRGPFPEQPPHFIADAEGRIHMTGLGRDRLVNVMLQGSSVPNTSLLLVTRPAKEIPPGVEGDNFDYVAKLSRSISGIVRDKVTGKPLPGVKVRVQQVAAVTDQDGRYKIVGCAKAGGYSVRAQPQTGQPYFADSFCIKEAAEVKPLIVDFELTSGILLSGRVLDSSKYKPPRAAAVEYHPLIPSSHVSKRVIGPGQAASSSVIGPDGSYSLVVLPGPGVVCVSASPRNSYAVASVDDKDLAKYLCAEKNGSQTLSTDLGGEVQGRVEVDKYNLLVPINPPEAAESLALDLPLQTAHVVRGMVVGLDGRPLSGVKVIGLTATPDDERLEGASFTVIGLNPRRSRGLFFQYAEKNLGKHLTIRGDEKGPLTVRLEPCGTVIGRIVNKHGQPVPQFAVYFQPGDDKAKTDSEGRFRMDVVPDQKYSLFMFRNLLKDVSGFQVGSSRCLDLGDLPLQD